MQENNINISISGKRLIILGAGESGIGAAILAKKKGYEVFVSDGGNIKPAYKKDLIDNNIEFEEGEHNVERILLADEIVKSPGIPEKNDLVKKIRAEGIGIISEIELAYRFKGNSKIIAITGSNGKSTTTTMIYHICKTAGLDCALVGNIGYSFARQVAEDPKGLYVAEISSFQLDDIKEFRPDVALLLNISEDHLDRYDYQIEKYIESKFRIIENQTAKDYFVYNLDDEIIQSHIKTISINHTNPIAFSMNQEVQNGGFIRHGKIIIKVNEPSNEEFMEMSVYDLAAKGKHNQSNALAAGVTTRIIGIRKEKVRDALQTYKTLEHRTEYVTTIRGVEFINDSKGTNVNSTWFALDTMTKPTILILGGVDKGNDYSILDELVKEKVKAIVCMGLDNTKIHEHFDGRVAIITDTKSAKEAVETAYKLASKGDAVLLSPACASFDLFGNYEERGTKFKEAVMDL